MIGFHVAYFMLVHPPSRHLGPAPAFEHASRPFLPHAPLCYGVWQKCGMLQSRLSRPTASRQRAVRRQQTEGAKHGAVCLSNITARRQNRRGQAQPGPDERQYDGGKRAPGAAWCEEAASMGAGAHGGRNTCKNRGRGTLMDGKRILEGDAGSSPGDLNEKKAEELAGGGH